MVYKLSKSMSVRIPKKTDLDPSSAKIGRMPMSWNTVEKRSTEDLKKEDEEDIVTSSTFSQEKFDRNAYRTKIRERANRCQARLSRRMLSSQHRQSSCMSMLPGTKKSSFKRSNHAAALLIQSAYRDWRLRMEKKYKSLLRKLLDIEQSRKHELEEIEEHRRSEIEELDEEYRMKLESHGKNFKKKSQTGCELIALLQRSNKRIEGDNVKLKDKCKKLKKENDALEKRLSRTNARIEKVRKQIREREKENKRIEKSLKQFKREETDIYNSIETRDRFISYQKAACERMHKTIDKIVKKVKVDEKMDSADHQLIKALASASQKQQKTKKASKKETKSSRRGSTSCIQPASNLHVVVERF